MKVPVQSSVSRQEKTNVSDQRQSGQKRDRQTDADRVRERETEQDRERASEREFSLTHWMKPTYTGGCNLLDSVSQFKCSSFTDTLRNKFCPNIWALHEPAK